ncbi:MAG: PspC domain-containing protein [Chlorobi bacterium]|nr:PspC domain-containing protein [Chlorobiota bacterium]
MNKTININLGGFAFQIEEDAYELLDSYLNKIRLNLGDNTETEEIINDIEARIAELFRTEVKPGTEAVTIDSVKEIIRLVGEPDEFVPEHENTQNAEDKRNPTGTQGYVHNQKSLFRDIERKIFGGVCSGLALYMNTDPVILRILFAVITYFWFPFVFIYLLLWIAMPKPKTPAQWFEMRGGQNYFKSKSTYENNPAAKPTGTPSSIYYGNDIVKGSGNVLKIIAGLAFTIISFLGLVSLVIFALFQNSTIGEMLPHNLFIYELPHRLLAGYDMWIISLSVLLLAGIPLLLFFYLGLKMIFNFRSNGFILGIIALLLWLTGLGLLFYGSLKTVTDFKTRSKVESQTKLLPVMSDTLYIKSLSGSDEMRYDEYLMNMNKMDLYIDSNGELIIEGNPVINLLRGNKLKITEVKEARGRTIDDAVKNTEGIRYNWEQRDSVLYFDKLFSLDDETMLRDQKIIINIFVPKGMTVKVDDDINYLINDNTDYNDEDENDDFVSSGKTADASGFMYNNDFKFILSKLIL